MLKEYSYRLLAKYKSNLRIVKDSTSLLKASIRLSDWSCLNAKLIIGKSCLLRGCIYFTKSSAIIEIGDNVAIGSGGLISIASGLTIESNVLISFDVLIMDNDGHSHCPKTRMKDLPALLSGKNKNWFNVLQKPIRISEGAWIGSRVTILKGTHVGRNTIVGSSSVVSGHLLDNGIYAGNPAKLVRLQSEIT